MPLIVSEPIPLIETCGAVPNSAIKLVCSLHNGIYWPPASLTQAFKYNINCYRDSERLWHTSFRRNVKIPVHSRAF